MLVVEIPEAWTSAVYQPFAGPDKALSLWGRPCKQLSNMFQRNRAVATVIYFISMFLTLFCALWVRPLPSWDSSGTVLAKPLLAKPHSEKHQFSLVWKSRAVCPERGCAPWDLGLGFMVNCPPSSVPIASIAA